MEITKPNRKILLTASTCVGSLLCIVLAGCSTGPTESGEDIGFLTAPIYNPDLPNKPTNNLLPLTTGNTWQMQSRNEDGVTSLDTLTVVGPATPPGGVPSIEIDATRNGQPWRKEFYSPPSAAGIFLTGAKDETSPLMVLSGPAPLLQYPFKEGDEWNWQGTVSIGGKASYPASSVSRLSAYDSATTKAGKFKLVRIDTILTLTVGLRDIRFPSVRWFAPGVGFVRRSFADKGRPASSELIRFNVR